MYIQPTTNPTTQGSCCHNFTIPDKIYKSDLAANDRSSIFFKLVASIRALTAHRRTSLWGRLCSPLRMLITPLLCILSSQFYQVYHGDELCMPLTVVWNASHFRWPACGSYTTQVHFSLMDPGKIGTVIGNRSVNKQSRRRPAQRRCIWILTLS